MNLFRSSAEARREIRKRIRLPVSFYPAAPPDGNTPQYQELERLRRQGLVFSLGSLLHAIGTKTSGLKSSRRTDAIASASKFIYRLDPQGVGLSYRVDFDDSDIKATFSQDIGIGVTALVAARVWRFPFDRLESIRGPGRRMDYRARRLGTTALLEAKGTQHARTQRKQIRHGLAKKKDHRRRLDRCDVELIISTRIGEHLGDPGEVVLADPPFDVPEGSFDERSDEVYRLRYWARVLGFAGLASAGRQLYLASEDLVKLGAIRARRLAPPEYVNWVVIGRRVLVGHWLALKKGVAHQRIRIFQGIDRAVLRTADAAYFSSLEAPAPTSEDLKLHETNTATYSIFPDGSVFGIGAPSDEESSPRTPTFWKMLDDGERR